MKYVGDKSDKWCIIFVHQKSYNIAERNLKKKKLVK